MSGYELVGWSGGPANSRDSAVAAQGESPGVPFDSAPASQLKTEDDVGTLTVGSLFSGIGAFDLGLERTGMVVQWQIEIDDYCNRILEKHWPHVRRYRDVRECGRHNLEPVDLICGGFPCQDLSVAGQRKGLAGERSGLWFEFHRILGELNPRWVVIENVPGLLSSNGGRDFAIVLRGLVQLGFRIAWRVLDAQYFGVPQRRWRVFLVGNSRNGSAAEVLFESEGGCWHPTPSREARARVADTITSGVGVTGNAPGRRQEDDMNLVAAPIRSNHYGDHAAAESHLVAFQCQGTNVGEMGTLRSGNGHVTGGVPFIAHTLCAEGADASEDGTGRGVPLVMAFDYGIQGTERTFIHRKNGKAQMLASRPDAIAGVMGCRRLTPRECERLMALLDDWTAFDAEGKPISDSARYRMLGNSIVTTVSEWIGQRIVEAT